MICCRAAPSAATHRVTGQNTTAVHATSTHASHGWPAAGAPLPLASPFATDDCAGDGCPEEDEDKDDGGVAEDDMDNR
ncbi:MAG: hypothetical protein LBK99_09995 [Opitutaceae bacterium]|jgi:hypothetical protein|nr:hypothetical protein [Opitutaceae bacterium]